MYDSKFHWLCVHLAVFDLEIDTGNPPLYTIPQHGKPLRVAVHPALLPNPVSMQPKAKRSLVVIVKMIVRGAVVP